MEKSPILNNPYEEPKLHYSTNENGELDYENIQEGRRIFTPDIHPMPTKQGEQLSVLEHNDIVSNFENHIVNLLRKEIKKWREQKYPNTTRVTKELLEFWFLNPERHDVRKLFYAQQESIETAIWLNEIADKTNIGQSILNILLKAQKQVSPDSKNHLPRISFKMATGTGKTVVMAALILYHFFNRQEYRGDTRFADNFLIVAPGITIRDRLNVLFYDVKTKQKSHRNDYYSVRDLVPSKLSHLMGSLNSKIVITNYHQLEQKTLQGNKRSPMDGKIVGKDENGKTIKQDAKEDYNLTIRRLLGKFKKNSRLLIINDEAHHCYLPKSKKKTIDYEADENSKAAVWFTGITEIAQRYKVKNVYDLTATPYYLQGSGYDPYSLFGWVVSDFGLIESIESGLVKIPFLPEKDTSQELTIPILRNLYDHVKDDLPKKGQKKKKKEAREDGEVIKEEPPQIPPLVQLALDQFYSHYEEYEKGVREKGEELIDLFTRPPVFIIVCNNTSVSKEMYKHIAGYDYQLNEQKVIVLGKYDLFSNYDQYNRLKPKSPTLIIDSDALENSNQINDDFKDIFSQEIEEFRKEYAVKHGSGSADKITEAEILREVVNTVGEKGKLGEHIRCVISVSMLTEGWDANTVTHIMGLRAFNSQLLCEQVAGRALRRMNYYLQGYDKDGFPTEDKRKIVQRKYPPEYAHIIGVPFKMFKGGSTVPTPPPPRTSVYALQERKEEFEITFPNLIGYRMEYQDGRLEFDYSNVEDFEIDGSRNPTQTIMGNALSPEEVDLEVTKVLEKRKSEILFSITKELIRYHFSDDDNNPMFQRFSRLKQIVEFWYDNKIKLLNINDKKYKKMILFENMKKVADHIAFGINSQLNTSEYIKPIFNYYNSFGSTRHVSGITSKEVYETEKSHVNYVVMDSGWEGICAKTFEEMPEVTSYVKNQFLDFAVPYVKEGKDRNYYPDFIARIKKEDGKTFNLIIEITGMNDDKAEKKWYVQNRWLPAVNGLKEKYNYDEWYFIEIADDIRNIRNELFDKIQSMI